jgi:hypothetical protein
MKHVRHCRYKECEKQFFTEHGNSHYCSKECYKANKKESQKVQFGIISEFRIGFLKNYKMLNELLIEKAQITMIFKDALKKGFNSKYYFGLEKSPEKIIWYRIGDYAFTIEQIETIDYITFKKANYGI